ncbi:MAG TPA: transglutaminase domain-containing protein [Aggregatilineaceae bacterium]|nr:transglutaminase domain-containing protein [Aggregatilineaceae bacterium]
MTTTQSMRPVRRAASRSAPPVPSRWRRRLRNYVRTIFARGDLSSLLIAWALMIVTAMAIDAAEWTTGLGSLPVISFFAVGFGFLLARSHYSELIALILSTIYSIAVVITVNAYTLIESGSFRSRVYDLAKQLDIWLREAASGGQPPNDSIAFVIFLSVLFWFLGHNAAWHIFRVDRVWRVIILTGMVLITSQIFYQGDTSLDGYLVAFVVLSLLLLIRSHIEGREFDWYLHRVNFPRHVRRAFFWAGGILAILIVFIAWIAPAGRDDKELDRLNKLMSGEAFLDFAELWNRLFSSLEGQGIATADYYGGDELELSGAIQLGDDEVMSVAVQSGPRYYWRSTTYDTYDFGSHKWQHFRSVRAFTDETGLKLNIGPTVPGARREVEQTFTMLLRSTRLVHAAPQPVLMGLPVEAELDCVEDMGRTCVNDNRQSDVSIIRARKTLRQGDQYSVTSSVFAGTANDLRQTAQEYPDWVLRLYLQGANSVDLQIRDLAAQIVSQAGAQTAYDKGKAIERWLRANIQYNETIPDPPTDRDPVVWFLFEEKQGYCNYYATAMVLMLRSQGIPARLAAGFAQGEWTGDSFLVRERDAHTWVEAYFPGYGWIEFEPTANEPPLDREGDQLPQAVLPTFTPMPSPTTTPTMTPSPDTPTEDSGADATPTSPAEQPFQPPTPTAHPTINPTPTAPPPPDVTEVDTDEGSGILRTILTTLLIILLVILSIVGAILFTIWYVEYRGLSGLNVVQRAYARMGIYGRWLGLRFNDTSTPDERRRYLVGEVPEGEKPINTITRAYIQDRYAAPDNRIANAQGRAAQEAWQDARGAFIRRKLNRWLRRGRKELND